MKARSLYQTVLQNDPNNAQALKSLEKLKEVKPSAVRIFENPPQEYLDDLMELYKNNKFREVLHKGKNLVIKFPNSFIIWNIIGVANNSLRNLPEAEEAFRKATKANPHYADGYNNLGNTLKELGNLKDAVSAYKRALQLKPDFAIAHHNMGVTLRDQGDLLGAINAYKIALRIKPDYTSTYNNLGNALRDQGKLKEAIEAYQFALNLKPDFAAAYYNMGVVLKDDKRLEEAISAYKQAIIFKPDYASAYNNLGIALKDQGRLKEAISAYGQALKIKPDDPDVHNNLGAVLREQGQLEEAIIACKRALFLKPKHASAYNNMGITLRDQGKLDEAIKAYECALHINPDYSEAFNNLGNTLRDQTKFDEAMTAYRRAINLKPEDGNAYNNMAICLQDQGKLDEAIAAYENALKLMPESAHTEAQIQHQRSHICEWNSDQTIEETCARLGIITKAVTPFSMLSLEDNAERQLKRSVSWAAEQYKQHALALHLRPQIQPTKLRIGYFSADFHNHATLYLMAGLLREHDDTQFEIFAYSYGRSATGDRREKAEQDVDHFFDVTEKSNLEICNLARTHELDIAVDLKGYTAHTRSGIFQLRLAPVQINYLGYPGSMGADFMDYIIADPIVIPKIQRQNYSEKIIYLPHSYQPNDNCREIAITQTTRADFNLPNDAFVFCCFNNNYKISPREFDIWMRLLSRKEGSVLWLLKSNKWAEANLRKEAQSRCVDPNRLIFADHLPHDEHLARHKHADLFIDTFNYNAHTTASDALWSGLPVVTKQGSQFAARVAASLLNAVGLSEMITNTEREYEDLIFDLSINPEKLSAVREKLMRNRLSQPLFDTKRYARNLENGFKLANDLYRSKGKIEDIYVREFE